MKTRLFLNNTLSCEFFRRKRLAALAGLAACVGCAGPHPVIVTQDLQPPTSPHAPYTLVVTLRNQGGGEGQAELTARLHPRNAPKQTAAQATHDVAFDPHETVVVTLSLPAAERGDYTAETEVQYPPQ